MASNVTAFDCKPAPPGQQATFASDVSDVSTGAVGQLLAVREQWQQVAEQVLYGVSEAVIHASVSIDW